VLRLRTLERVPRTCGSPWVEFAIGLTTLVASITDFLLPSLGKPAPRLGSASVALWGLVTWWMVYRFRGTGLSPRQFADADLLRDLESALRVSGMPPCALELEVTEGVVIGNPERALATLQAIKRLGVQLAIDDFGTGYSSLAQLKRFPVDELKIYRSFIRGLPGDTYDAAITEAIIVMCRTLQLTVVAEGVETSGQREFLRQRGCTQMQGYLFSRPLPAAEFATLARRHFATADAC